MAEKNGKHYVSDNAQLMAEWDWEKNAGLDPYAITWKSDKKAMWICTECGHSWEAAVKNRSNGRGCPKCARIRQAITFNQNRIRSNGSLATENPHLAKQWHPTKNGVLTPYDVTSKSGKSVWWICNRGHDWEAGINNRSFQNNGCPYCAGQKVWIGFNDLLSTNPQLASQWHPTKNAPLTAQEVTGNSGQTVWWQCKEGHEWESSIDNRSKGAGCPFCSGRFAIAGKTDLATTHPEIAAEWHPTENGNLSPSMFSIGSKKKVWWKCSKGHEWQAVIYSRKHNGCPTCSGETRTSFPEQVIFYYLQQITPANNRYIVAPRVEIDVYLPELKIGIEYDGAYFHNSLESNAREEKKENILSQQGITLLRVKELLGAESKENTDNIIYCKQYPNYLELKKVLMQLIAKINIIRKTSFSIDVDVERDRGKIYAQYVTAEKEHSLQMMNPDIAAQWHPYKNETLTPLMVTPNSGKRVWWLCHNGHEWPAVIQSRTRGNGCPYCAGFMAIPGENDLSTVNPQLAAEWHPTKNNELTPDQVLPQSNKKVWWRCEKGHEWPAGIHTRTNGSGCPYCANAKVLAGYNDLATTHPNLVDEWHPTKNDDLLPSMFASGSEQKVWWLCSVCGNEWPTSIKKRSMGRGCPKCGNKKKGISFSQTMISENGSLADRHPDIAAQWHPTKNGAVQPSEVTCSTRKVFWWKCVEGHEWDAPVVERTRSKGCPICSGKRIVPGINDLATKMPALAKQWHPTKNGELKPSDVTVGSGKKVWWLCCECGHEWPAIIGNRSKGSGCPYCAGRKPKTDKSVLSSPKP